MGVRLLGCERLQKTGCNKDEEKARKNLEVSWNGKKHLIPGAFDFDHPPKRRFNLGEW